MAAHELGLVGRIACVDAAAHPVNRDANIIRHNPLGQVPTLLLDNGEVLYDSDVICQYLQDIAGGHALIPAGGIDRLRCLRDQALGDGIMNAALLVRFERALRTEEMRNRGWESGQLGKIDTGLAFLETQAKGMTGRVDLATISYVCALGYIDFRLPDIDWGSKYPVLAAWYAGWADRPSFAATTPKG